MISVLVHTLKCGLIFPYYILKNIVCTTLFIFRLRCFISIASFICLISVIKNLYRFSAFEEINTDSNSITYSLPVINGNFGFKWAIPLKLSFYRKKISLEIIVSWPPESWRKSYLHHIFLFQTWCDKLVLILFYQVFAVEHSWISILLHSHIFQSLIPRRRESVVVQNFAACPFWLHLKHA